MDYALPTDLFSNPKWIYDQLLIRPYIYKKK